MPTIRSLCGILPLPSLLVRALAPKQLFGLTEDTGPVPRSPSGCTSGAYGLRSSDGRLLLNRPFAHSATPARHKGAVHHDETEPAALSHFEPKSVAGTPSPCPLPP